MGKKSFSGAFFLGALTLVWIGAGFIGSNVLALAVTAIIGAVYGFGALELHRFRQATSALSSTLETIPGNLESLDDWLVSVPSSLRNSVRLRIEGERTGLPGPALAPYLAGLLVMLGMLGTFLGMVVTLNGAVFALEGTTDLQAIRAAFSTPIKGLGLAFGTSVAGVATSAMLGLMSTLCRRERMLAAQLLDTKISTALYRFSFAHQRQEAFKALQLQSQAMPAIVAQLQSMMIHAERISQQLSDRLLANQESFHRDVKSVYTDLAYSVDKSLCGSLAQNAHAASEGIKPIVEAALAGIAKEAKLMHERMIATTQMQLDGLSTRLSATASTAGEAWIATLNREWKETNDRARISASTNLGEMSRLMMASEELIRSRVAAESHWTKQHTERMDQVASLFHSELQALREAEAMRGNAAVQRLGELQTALTGHLTTLGAALEDPIARLLHTAAEAPRAAAEVIGQLRLEVSNSVARDNELLLERGRIMATLNLLLDGINHASIEQRSAIDTLVASSAAALKHAGDQFSEKVGTESAKLSDISSHVSSSAVEVSSLSESFRFAVGSFSDANEKLIGNLQRIEGAMDKSLARSDDQLAYYVAQAREIIDLSIMSQKEIFEELRQLPGRQALFAEEVANG
jgi:hypothetical protein